MIWLHSEGNFSFSLWGHKITTRGKIYKLAITTGNKCVYYQFVWKNHAPPKVKFFAWLLLQERIQCKTNLKRKNVLDSDTCDLCGLAPETPDHIISQCEFARRFWLHLGWDPASIPPVSKLWEVQGQAGAPARSLSTMFLLCCWHLWLYRHGVVFRHQAMNLRYLLLECHNATQLWRWRLPVQLRDEVEHWSNLFLM